MGLIGLEEIAVNDGGSLYRPPRYDLLRLPLLGRCLLYTSPSPRDGLLSRMPSSA